MSWDFIKNSLLIILFGCVSCKKKDEDRPAILYLASSLLPLAPAIEKAAKNSPLQLKFLSSAAIALQVSEGAPCDALVLADRLWQKHLLEKKLIEEKTRILITNELVLASTKEAKKEIFVKTFSWHQMIEAYSDQKLILADPNYVPLGRYSKIALENARLTPMITTAIMAHSAQMALLLLKQKAASWAILYRSDIDHHNIVELALIKEFFNEAIEYPFVICRHAQEKHRQLIEKILLSDDFKMALRRHNFGVLE